MRLFALSDPHLSLGMPGKAMDKFGPQWVDHAGHIERNWRAVVGDDDLVLVAGDISWAMRLDGPHGARPDLEFLGRLPGQKVLIKGNHDFWWGSVSAVRKALPAGMFAIQNDAIRVGPVVLGGTRLWDVPGLKFDAVMEPAALAGWESAEAGRADDGGRPATAGRGVEAPPDPRSDPAESERIYRRELERLRLSLAAMERLAADAGDAPLRVALTHYPPCGPGLEPTEATELFEQHGVRHVVFGHLHDARRDLSPPPFGERNGVRYHLTACDFLNFRPVLIEEFQE